MAGFARGTDMTTPHTIVVGRHSRLTSLASIEPPWIAREKPLRRLCFDRYHLADLADLADLAVASIAYPRAGR